MRPPKARFKSDVPRAAIFLDLADILKKVIFLNPYIGTLDFRHYP